MATKKEATSVVKREEGAVVPFRDRIAAIVNKGRSEVAKMPTSGGNALSFAKGVITAGGVRIGNELSIIPLVPQFERTYYDTQYDPDRPASPACYSYDGEKPHEKSASPQAKSCDVCPLNAFGTDIRGKGKACKEGMKLALVAADQARDADAAKSAPIYIAKFSVLNTKDVAPTIQAMYAQGNVPFQFTCKLTAHPDERRQVINTLEVVGVNEDEAQLNALMARAEAAEELLAQPYPEPQEGTAKPAPNKRSTRKF